MSRSVGAQSGSVPSGSAGGATEGDVLDAQQPDRPPLRGDQVEQDDDHDRERSLAGGEHEPHDRSGQRTQRRCTGPVVAHRERHGARFGADHRVGRELTEAADVVDEQAVGVGLGGDHQVLAVRCEADLSRGVGELRSCRRIEGERAVPRRHGDQEAAEVQVALDRAAVAGVQNVNEVPVRGALTGKFPRVLMTCCKRVEAPCTPSTDKLLLPALTAYSS